MLRFTSASKSYLARFLLFCGLSVFLASCGSDEPEEKEKQQAGIGSSVRMVQPTNPLSAPAKKKKLLVYLHEMDGNEGSFDSLETTMRARYAEFDLFIEKPSAEAHGHAKGVWVNNELTQGDLASVLYAFWQKSGTTLEALLDARQLFSEGTSLIHRMASRVQVVTGPSWPTTSELWDLVLQLWVNISSPLDICKEVVKFAFTRAGLNLSKVKMEAEDVTYVLAQPTWKKNLDRSYPKLVPLFKAHSAESREKVISHIKDKMIEHGIRSNQDVILIGNGLGSLLALDIAHHNQKDGARTYGDVLLYPANEQWKLVEDAFSGKPAQAPQPSEGPK